MSFMCPGCGANPAYDSVFQYVLELRQLEVREITDAGEIDYTDESSSLDWYSGEPFPPGYTPDDVKRKLDFFFCSKCRHTWTSDEFLPVTPEKLAAAMSGLLSLTEDLEDDD